MLSLVHMRRSCRLICCRTPSTDDSKTLLLASYPRKTSARRTSTSSTQLKSQSSHPKLGQAYKLRGKCPGHPRLTLRQPTWLWRLPQHILQMGHLLRPCRIDSRLLSCWNRPRGGYYHELVT